MRLGGLKEAWVRKGVNERLAPLQPADIRSIAIIKHGALGDLVHTRPLILALRNHFPNAAITFSGASHYTNGIPRDLVDRVHLACGKEKRYSRGEIYRSLKALGPHDIIFDITQSARSHWLTLLNPAKLKIGFTHKGIERFVYDVAIHRAEFRFEAETFLEQLHVLDLPFDWPPQYGYQPLPAPLPGDYIVYFPTASVDYKIWPAEHFAQLISRSVRTFPRFRHIVLSGLAAWERESCARIVAALPAECPVETFTGGEQTEALIANAHCVVANDTGIRNLAIARGVPTLGIFMPYLLFGYLPLFGHHAAVGSRDGSPPAVDECFAKLVTLLERLNGANEAACHHE